MEEKEDYYEVGSSIDIVVSNSSIASFDPELGGSPKRFLAFLDNKEEVKSKAFVTGSLLHKWHEDREAFHIASVAKPSEKLGEVADAVLSSIQKRISDAKVRISEMEEENPEKAIDGKELEDFITSVLSPESSILKQEILSACRMLNWNNKYGDDAIIKNACPPIFPYVQDSLKAEGLNKIYMTVANSELLEGMTKSIKEKEVVYQSLFDNSDDFSNTKVLVEFEHYWGFDIPYFDEAEKKELKTRINCKLKTDKLVIDFDKKICKIKDLKSTASSPYGFVKSFVKFDYIRQFTFYYLGMLNYLKDLGEENTGILADWKFQFENIVIEKGGLFECVSINIEEEAVKANVPALKETLKDIAWHVGNKIWNMSKEEYLNGGFITITKEQIEKNKASN